MREGEGEQGTSDRATDAVIIRSLVRSVQREYNMEGHKYIGLDRN